jgi:hypothetical protein
MTKNDNEYMWPGYSSTDYQLRLRTGNNQAEGIYRDIYSPYSHEWMLNINSGHQKSRIGGLIK